MSMRNELFNTDYKDYKDYLPCGMKAFRSDLTFGALRKSGAFSVKSGEPV